MKNIIVYIFTLLIAISIIACTSDKQEETKTEELQPAATTTEGDTTKIACDGGCGMVHAKSEMTAYVDNGETKYFCSEHCKEHYLAQKEQGDEK